MHGATSPQCPIRPMMVSGVTSWPSVATRESRCVYFVTRPPPCSTQPQTPSVCEEVVLQVREFAPTWKTPRRPRGPGGPVAEESIAQYQCQSAPSLPLQLVFTQEMRAGLRNGNQRVAVRVAELGAYGRPRSRPRSAQPRPTPSCRRGPPRVMTGGREGSQRQPDPGRGARSVASAGVPRSRQAPGWTPSTPRVGRQPRAHGPRRGEDRGPCDLRGQWWRMGGPRVAGWR